MDLLSRRHELVKVADDRLGFGLGNTDNVDNKARIEEYGLPSRDWVSAYEGMLGDDGVASNSTAHSFGAIGLDLRRMEG